MNFTIYVPESVSSGAEARSHLEEAFAGNLKPEAVPKAGLKRLSFYLSTEQMVRVRQAAVETPFETRDAIEGLIYAAWSRRTRSQAVGEAVPVMDESTKLRSKLQAKIDEVLSIGRIALIEGSTGIGKGRVMARAARKRADAGRVIGLCAPTLAVLRQLICEWEVVCKEVDRDVRDKVAILIGRNNFVDQTRLAECIEDPEIPDRDRARAWWEAGGMPHTEISRTMCSLMDLRWMVEDLRHAAPEFPIEQVRCDGASDEISTEIYTAMREKVLFPDTQVIFMTQAMLCRSVVIAKMRPNMPEMLPQFDSLIIDEAHELEEQMARATGHDLSFQTLGAEIKCINPKDKSAILDLIAECVRVLQAYPEGAHSIGHSEDTIFSDFRLFATKLSKRLKGALLRHNPKSIREEQARTRIEDAKQALERALSGKESVQVSFSHRLRKPSLTIGPLSLRKHFTDLWERTKSAALVSATLLTISKDGTTSSNYMAMKLGIPSARRHEVPAIHSSWIYSIPQLYMPSEHSAPALSYPRDSEEQGPSLENWHAEIALRLDVIAQNAVGGTLALCRSYADIDALAARMSTDSGRVLRQNRAQSVSFARDRFITLSREGMRPIWLATGPAWTGLDLRDGSQPDPAQDNILTDLAIVRVPINHNRSSVHLARKRYRPWEMEMLEASFILRQGLGRLIRREGVTNRRIWFLDGRHLTKGSVFKQIAKALTPYRKVILFD